MADSAPTRANAGLRALLAALAALAATVREGAEASLATADVYLNRPGLSGIVDLMRAARATVRTIRRCLIASLCYNLVAAALAVTGVIGPLIAAVLMPISSLTVVGLTLGSPTPGVRK